MSFLGMNTVSYDELTKIITKEAERGSLGFIASVTTPWHALGFESWYIECWLPSLNAGKGFVLARPHSISGLALTIDHFAKSPHDLNVVFVVMDRSNESLFLKSKQVIKRVLSSHAFERAGKKDSRKTIQIISPRKPDYYILPSLLDSRIIKTMLPKFVLIDEGIGSYMTESVWKRKIYYEGKRDALSAFKRLISKKLSRTMERAFRECEIESRLLFSRSYDGNLFLNERIGKSYKSLLKESVKRLTFEKSVFSGEKIALVLTQPFSESNQIGFSEELALIIRKINDLLEKGFAKVLIKPHPRESLAKFSTISENYPLERVRILPKEFPSEEIISLLDSSTDIVVGCTSTAFITSAALFGVSSYTYGTELKSLIANKNSLFHLSFSEFSKLSSRYVRQYYEL